MTELTDRELIRRAADGSREDFDELVVRFRDRLVSFAWRFVADRDAAEDLAQETLLRAYRACDRYDGRAEVSTWLFTIARNLCLNARRDRARHPTSSLAGEDDERSADLPDRKAEAPGTRLDRAELSQAIDRAIAALPERQRTALILARYEGMPYEEIARVLDTTVAAVKLCVFRARESLRETLAHHIKS